MTNRSLTHFCVLVICAGIAPLVLIFRLHVFTSDTQQHRKTTRTLVSRHTGTRQHTTAYPPLTPDTEYNTTQDPRLNIKEKNIYQKRGDHLQYVCENGNVRPRPSTNKQLKFQLRYIPSLNLMYCPVEGDLTPAWLDSLQQMTGSQNNTENKIIKMSNLLKNYSDNDLPTYLNSTLKVIFSKDPYWQLFELYVNNFVVPNYKYLDESRSIIKTSRQKVVPVDRCDFNITFDDFIQHVLHTPFKRVAAGVSNKCDVCTVNYDVIGKVETLHQDTVTVNALLSNNKTPVLDIEKVDSDDKIRHFVKSAFQEKKKLTCVSNHGILLRLWRQLQIWDYVSTETRYPYTSGQSDAITYTEYIITALEARRAFSRSRSRSRLRSNTDDAFMLAYRPTVLRNLERLRKIYIHDFYLFDYPDRPPSIFFKQGPLVEFSYFDVIETT